MSDGNPLGLSADELHAAAMWRWCETEAFAAWFTKWHGTDEDYEKGSELHDVYLYERHCANMGWIASRMPDSYKLTKKEFEQRIRLLYWESKKVLP